MNDIEGRQRRMKQIVVELAELRRAWRDGDVGRTGSIAAQVVRLCAEVIESREQAYRRAE